MITALNGAFIPAEILSEACDEGLGSPVPEWKDDPSYFWSDNVGKKRQNEQS